MSRTAEALRVERSNLYRKMKAYGLLPGAARRARTMRLRLDPVRAHPG